MSEQSENVEQVDGEARVREALERLGVPGTFTRHGRVGSLAEAAAARGVTSDRLVKTMVVRRGEDDFLLVLVPGDRTISWPRLRAHLGVSRLSMPDAATALAVTGYERGTITPLGTTRDWPVVADSSITGEISLGGGAHGVGVMVDADRLLPALGATRADVTDPAP
ncbi:aminoacyl-tRNA deacylase [Salana multivorans]